MASSWIFWLVALAAGVATGLLVWSSVQTSKELLDPIRRRLGALREENREVVAAGAKKAGVTDRLFSLLEPKEEADRDKRRIRLSQAGYRSQGAVGTLIAVKLVTILILVAGALAAKFGQPQWHISGAILGLMIAFAILMGWLLPEGWLDRVTENRKATLMEGLPDALDLLVACTEAGLSLNAALERVVEQLPSSYPILARELGMVNAEMRAGVERTAALKNLAERTGLEEIRGLVSLITHSARLGTGIAGTLRIYATEFRDRRMQRAEEIAATVSTKMIFPLVLCMFPSFFVVAVGPAVLGVIRALSGTSFG